MRELGGRWDLGSKRLIPIVDMQAPERNSDHYSRYVYIERVKEKT